MKRIGIECESIEGKNPSWGVGRMISRLLEELSCRSELKNNFKFVLYFKDRIPNLPYLSSPIFEKKIIPVPLFPGRLFPIYYFGLLPARLWFERLDWMFWPNYMLPILSLNKSLVMLTEDVYYEVHLGKLPFRYKLAYGIFGWWTAKFAKKIMAISETSKKNISDLYNINTNRVFTNYLGVDRRGGQQEQTKSGSLFGNYLLYVGQAFPRRHLKETLLAFERIAGDYGEIGLVAIGPDKYEFPVIKRLVDEINNRLGRKAIVHKDYISDSELSDLYAGARALIYISDREAFGLPPLEALAYGIPAVIMNNQLGHELFGENAFYAESGSREDIEKSIRQALTDRDKRIKIKSEGPLQAEKYNWAGFTDNFLKSIEK